MSPPRNVMQVWFRSLEISLVNRVIARLLRLKIESVEHLILDANNDVFMNRAKLHEVQIIFLRRTSAIYRSNVCLDAISRNNFNKRC